VITLIPNTTEVTFTPVEAYRALEYSRDAHGARDLPGSRFRHLEPWSQPVRVARTPSNASLTPALMARRLAYDMNGQPLSFGHGALLRLRNEVQLGFKQVKWNKGIEFVADFTDIGGGYGGYNEDHEFFGYRQSI
jgi:DMSO/TMAO reductase YedYZ molybdopterin-dependent catalytic subunit